MSSVKASGVRPSRQRIAAHEARGEWPRPPLSTRLANRLAGAPDLVNFTVDGASITVRDLAERVARLASGLRRRGIGTGDVVSWQLPGWIEGVVLTFALDRIGAISNPLLPILRERELSFILREARSRALVVPGSWRGFDHRELARTLCSGAPELEHVFVARAEPLPGQQALDDALGAAVDPGLPPSPFSAHDTSAVFYTSGTTSDPKGVLHTPSTLGSFMDIQQGLIGAAGRVSILWFPLTHIGGIAAFAVGPVAHGTRTVFLEPFDAARGLELIEREGVTSAGGPTPILQALLATPGFTTERVRSVEIAGIGATDVPPDLVRAVRRQLDCFVYRSYGMTECPMATAGRRGDAEEALVTTDGRATPGVVLRVVDEAGRPRPPGCEGEVELFGPQLCVGYIDAERTREAFRPDGFIRTGDLAVVDDAGFVRITGRTKEVILRKGETLSARAIEDDLHAHPGVAQVAVVGLPDAASGERVCACIVARPGGEALDVTSIRRFMVGRGVMAQRIPEQVEILDELPRNATGKVLKHELRARFGRP